ncbi:MAG: hypothetical protein ACI9MB_004707, partial [Verrucomicrobiales bacterium]
MGEVRVWPRGEQMKTFWWSPLGVQPSRAYPPLLLKK